MTTSAPTLRRRLSTVSASSELSGAAPLSITRKEVRSYLVMAAGITH